MRNRQRKSALKVRSGKVQRKNRTNLSPNYFCTQMPELIIDRQRPGRGYTHLVSQKELRNFVEKLPDWEILKQGLNAIVLAEGEPDRMGCYYSYSGVIEICAWNKDIIFLDTNWIWLKEHIEILEKLNVLILPGSTKDEDGESTFSIMFNRDQARAFQMVHILIHELGHHHDKITTQSQKRTARGEDYAENYAKKYEDCILDIYYKVFK